MFIVSLLEFAVVVRREVIETLMEPELLIGQVIAASGRALQLKKSTPRPHERIRGSPEHHD